MQQVVVEKFLKPMTNYFKVAKHIDEEDFFERVSEDLSKFDAATLTAAFEHFRVSHKYTTMPSIKVMLDACQDFVERRNRAKSKPQPRQIKDDASIAWEPGRMAQAREHLRTSCEFAQIAAREGWIWQLWYHYRKIDRSPTQREIEGFKARKRGFDRSVESAKTFLWKDQQTAKHLGGIAGRILRETKELEEMVLNQ